MCFYDQYQHTCGDFKWGALRQPCNKENRTSEICGFKQVMTTYPRNEKCKTCAKMDTKIARIVKELGRIRPWGKEDRTGPIKGPREKIAELEVEIEELEERRWD